MQAFDYVIVGAGSAGCVLANRLSENVDASVAIVEAGGPDKRQEIHIPAAFSKLFKSECDWAYFTEEQTRLQGRKLYWPRGRVLGGSSSLNAMIYTRGNRADFDEWARLGNDGWGYDEVRAAFDRTLLSVSELRSPNPLSHAFVAACEENGIAPTDFDADRQEGAGLFRVTQRGGKRCSCAVAYLKPVMNRKNLAVFTNAHTTRVLFDGGRASGIELIRNGTTEQLRAGREVLLCGGAINSPQLLMLSGIGAADELRRHGIAVVADLPSVGENLQDHLVTGAMHACTQPVTLARAESIANIARFLLFRRGMLTSNVAEAGAFVRVEADAQVPDIELIFGATYYMSHGFANPKGDGFTIGAILQHPKSRGSIRLRSGDPMAAPRIDPNYLADDSDLRVLVDGVRLCRRIARAKAFDAWRGDEVWPGTQEDLDVFVRATAETLYHPVGTCAMGSVVDDRLRVRGVEGLRVVDASVMPTIITGHPNAAVVMIAEKAAEFLHAGL